MDKRHEQFRDRLIGLERITPSLKEQYELEMRGLLESKLNGISRAVNIFALVLSVVIVGFFVYRLMFTDLPALAKIGIAAGMLFSMGWVVLMVKILRRGSMNTKTDANAMAGLTWAFLVIMIILFMLAAGRTENHPRGIMMVLNGLVFLLGGVVNLLGNNINQEDLHTRESLLKIKYRLVDFNEHLSEIHPDLSGDMPSSGGVSSFPEKTEPGVNAMYEKKLSPMRKLGILLLIPIMLAQTAFFVYALFAEWGLPALAKAGFGLGVAFSLTFAAILARIVMKGSINIKKDPNIITTITWVFLVFFIMIIMMLAGEMHDQMKGISMLLNTLVFFIFGVVFLLQNIIHQANLRTREKLLEIDNQLADLNKFLSR